MHSSIDQSADSRRGYLVLLQHGPSTLLEMAEIGLEIRLSDEALPKRAQSPRFNSQHPQNKTKHCKNGLLYVTTYLSLSFLLRSKFYLFIVCVG